MLIHLRAHPFTNMEMRLWTNFWQNGGVPFERVLDAFRYASTKSYEGIFGFSVVQDIKVGKGERD